MAKQGHKKKGLQSSVHQLAGNQLVRLGVVALAVYGVVSLVYQGVQIMHSSEPLHREASTITASWVPETVKRWEKPIDEMATKYNLDPNLLAIIMTLESGGDSKAGSSKGAKGLMQVTDPTAKDIAQKFLKKPRTTYDLWDPATNIEFGAAYLAHLRDVFGDKNQGPSWNETVELVAAGYNGGPGAAISLAGGKGLDDVETVSYSRDAFNMWRERHVSVSPTFERWLDRGGSHLIDAAKVQK